MEDTTETEQRYLSDLFGDPNYASETGLEVFRAALSTDKNKQDCKYAVVMTGLPQFKGRPALLELHDNIEDLKWEFNDWKTRLAGIYSLDSADFHLDWNSMLPYPDPELVDVIPETAKCTYYYNEELNKDCEVDLLDFQLLAAKWLMTTTN